MKDVDKIKAAIQAAIDFEKKYEKDSNKVVANHAATKINTYENVLRMIEKLNSNNNECI